MTALDQTIALQGPCGTGAVHIWVPAMLKNGAGGLVLPVGAELRQVLNAAWLARVGADHDPERDLTGQAFELMWKIIKSKTGKAESPRIPDGTGR